MLEVEVGVIFGVAGVHVNGERGMSAGFRGTSEGDKEDGESRVGRETEGDYEVRTVLCELDLQ